MEDCIFNMTEHSPASSSEARMSSVEQQIDQHATLTSESSSPTLVADNKVTPSSPRPPKAHRWYFQESVTEEQTKDSTLTLSLEHLPPVKIDASKKSTTWSIPLPPDHEQGAFYDVVLGVSVQKLKIDCIESILFRFGQLEVFDFGFEYEVIRADELKRLSSKDGLEPDDNKEIQGQECDKDDVVFLWKLFFRCYGYENGLTITTHVNSWTDLPHEYGSLDLHFVELCVNSPALYNADLLYREHRPYASWLIDPNRSACAEYSILTNKMKSCSNYTLSGDGSFAAIKTIAGEEKYLEVWSLKDSDTARKTPVVSKEKGDSPGIVDSDTSTQEKVAPHYATPVAWMPLSDTDLDVSISWDGSLLALIDRTRWDTNADSGDDSTIPHQSEFAVFQCSWDDTKASDTSSSRMSLVRYDVQRTCPGLRDCLIEGVFHMVDKSNPDLRDQLFITNNGVTIDIYSTFDTWNPLRSIVLDSAVTSIGQAPDTNEDLFNRTQGRYLITGNESTAFTFDIVLGTLVSFSSALGQEELRMMSYFSGVSEDGSLIAIPGFRHVNVYRTRTWTLHGSYEFHEIASEERVLRGTFLYNSSLLVVNVFDNFTEQTRPGYVLDVATMSLVDRMAPEGYVGITLSPMDGSEQGLVYLGHSQLWDMRLEDRIYQCGQRRPDRCTDLCKNPECHDHGVQEGTSSSGLHFKTQRVDASTSAHLKHDKRSSLAVIMTDIASSQVKTTIIPFAKSDIVSSATFHANCRYLLIVTGEVQMAWTVPTTFDGDFRLYMVVHAYFLKSWSICAHGFMRYHINCYGDEFRLVGHITHPIPELMPSSVLLAGLSVMLEIYEVAGSGLRQDILRFYGSTLNLIFDEHQTIIFTYLNDLSNSRNVHVYCDFLKHLLAFPGTRWVPPQDLSVEVNPLAMILNKASTEPSAISLAQIFVDYCLRRAREEQDQHFLLPIYQCLHLIVDPKQHYSEFALNVYRDLAYFPAQSRYFIQGHHALANPLKFRWAFWRPYPWGLHQYKDQVMQLETIKVPSPPKGNFSREIFQASFEMLWRKTEVEGSQAESEEASKVNHPSTMFSWPQSIWAMLLRMCRLKYNTTVECYPFELKALDNPALMALVEYKWNTIGFNYWLVRFLGQICYYILVLTAIFLQIDGGYRVTEERGPEGIFIAIIVVALVFLWLELVQLMKDKQGYIRSIYNYVDLLVFLMPLAGAVNQIMIMHNVVEQGLNPGLLSFSVLFVSLHFLFELRAFQVVCHFVSIIIRAIYSIRVFFFVFAGGLLAFAVAILHIFHACVDAEHCSYFTDGFAPNLLRALSVTYFMMGGNYDQVEGGFTSNNVAFHALMMTFFFFTVILMLNVLIALVNNAIDDGDQSWQLDWLEYRMRYVESAENLTYDIPGFREKHNYFPDTIYYTGTPQQVRDYEKKTRQMKEESSPSTFIPEPEMQAQVLQEFTTTASTTMAASEKTKVVKKNEHICGDNSVVMVRLVDTELWKQLEAEREKSEKQIGQLQHQLKEQQQMLAQILAKLE